MDSDSYIAVVIGFLVACLLGLVLMIGSSNAKQDLELAICMNKGGSMVIVNHVPKCIEVKEIK